MSKKPVALIIMDGFGHNPSDYGNAIHAAKKPNLDKFMQGPNTLIGASGLDVGLPDGQMGNSEVGHTNIGAGRIVYQMLVKITKDIEDGKFFENPAISAAIDACKEKGTALHLMGLLSPGAFTAIFLICTDCWKWQNARVCLRCMFTHSWTAVTNRRHLLLDL